MRWSEEPQDQLTQGSPHTWRAHRDGKISVGTNGKTSNCLLLCPSHPSDTSEAQIVKDFEKFCASLLSNCSPVFLPYQHGC